MNNLGDNCLNSPNKDFVSSSLKSIGNIGQYNQKLADILSNCALNKNNKMEIRINAIDSLRKISSSIETLESIIKNDEEDNELRTNAFLILIKSNPSYQFDSFDNTFVNKDSNTQVCWFIF